MSFLILLPSSTTSLPQKILAWLYGIVHLQKDVVLNYSLRSLLNKKTTFKMNTRRVVKTTTLKITVNVRGVVPLPRFLKHAAIPLFGVDLAPKSFLL